MKKIIAAATVAGLVLPTMVGAQNAVNGKKLYTDKCESCHGEQGDGNGPAGKVLKPKPTDFIDEKLMSGIKDEDLSKVIKEGGKAVGKSPLMAAFDSQLKDEEIKDIVTYIRTFGIRRSSTSSPVTAPSHSETVRSAEEHGPTSMGRVTPREAQYGFKDIPFGTPFEDVENRLQYRRQDYGTTEFAHSTENLIWVQDYELGELKGRFGDRLMMSLKVLNVGVEDD